MGGEGGLDIQPELRCAGACARSGICRAAAGWVRMGPLEIHALVQARHLKCSNVKHDAICLNFSGARFHLTMFSTHMHMHKGFM